MKFEKENAQYDQSTPLLHAVKLKLPKISDAHKWDPTANIPARAHRPSLELLACPDLLIVPSKLLKVKHWIPRVLLVTTCALYGTNFGTVKYLEETMHTSTLYFLRFFVATLAVSPFLLLEHEGFQLSALVGGVEIGGYLFVAFAAQGLGLEESSASSSAFIASLSVICVPIFHFLSGGSLSAKTILSSVMACVGVFILVLAEFTFSLSDAETLLQPVMFGLALWRLEGLLNKYPKAVIPLTLAQLSTVAGMSALWCCILGTFPPLHRIEEILTDTRLIPGILWVSIVTTALTFAIDTYSIKFLKATEVSLIFTTEPLFGALFARFLLEEKLDWHTCLGGAVIISSCLWGSLPEPDRNQDDSNEKLCAKKRS